MADIVIFKFDVDGSSAWKETIDILNRELEDTLNDIKKIVEVAVDNHMDTILKTLWDMGNQIEQAVDNLLGAIKYVLERFADIAREMLGKGDKIESDFATSKAKLRNT